MNLGDEVTVWMDAPPDKVWDLVSDVTRIGEFSPETFEAKWTRGSTGPEVGAFFAGHVKRNGVGPIYWSPNNWGYRLAARGGGTDVTEFFRLDGSLPTRLYWLVLGPLRGRTNRKGMRTTLERMKAVVET